MSVHKGTIPKSPVKKKTALENDQEYTNKKWGNEYRKGLGASKGEKDAASDFERGRKNFQTSHSQLFKKSGDMTIPKSSGELADEAKTAKDEALKARQAAYKKSNMTTKKKPKS